MGTLRRLLLAAIFAGLVLGIAIVGIFVWSAPEAVSLVLEPLSLLLLPGLAFAVPLFGPHDFSPVVVAVISYGFYFVVFFVWLGRRRRLRRS